MHFDSQTVGLFRLINKSGYIFMSKINPVHDLQRPISIKNGMKPLKETSLRFGEILHYVRNKYLGRLSKFTSDCMRLMTLLYIIL
jgi:hypothetical protein